MRNRKSSRLRNYDYSSPGAHFVTICTHAKAHLFGSVKNSVVHLNTIGTILQNQIVRTQEVRQNARIDSPVIMPNHVHILLFIYNVGATRWVAPSKQFPTLQPNSPESIIGQIKSLTTREIRRLPGMHSYRSMATEVL
jgi:putative transposase